MRRQGQLLYGRVLGRLVDPALDATTLLMNLAYRCGSSSSPIALAQDNKFKIGLLLPMTGPFASTGPRGPIFIDAQTRDIVQNVYIRKVEKTGGQLYNVEFETLKDVKDPGKAK